VRRREVIAMLGGTAVAWPLVARAEKKARIGFVGNPLDNPVPALGYPAFLDELKKSGFRVGENLAIETIDTYQDTQRVFAETADLVRSNVELLVVPGAEIALRAAVAASGSIPIVMWAINFDPIARGYVKSLAQPGGNVTGIVSLQTELAAKQVELLTQAIPDRTRLAVLWDTFSADQFIAAERQARSLQLEVQSQKLENPPYDFDAAFRSLSKNSAQMLLVLSSQHFTLSRSHIAELAIQQRLPSMFIFKVYVQAGGLMSYGVDPVANFRQVGFYVAKILSGAKPADLPVEQAAKFELVINLKTAKAIGVDLSTAIQLRARRGDRIGASAAAVDRGPGNESEGRACRGVVAVVCWRGVRGQRGRISAWHGSQSCQRPTTRWKHKSTILPGCCRGRSRCFRNLPTLFSLTVEALRAAWPCQNSPAPGGASAR
jgi:putative ABC transport system substrate-binding protein